jgi:hypothetical protein
MFRMDQQRRQTEARLKWEIACERLAFALEAPKGAAPDDFHTLESAVSGVRQALDELLAAFASPSGGD